MSLQKRLRTQRPFKMQGTSSRALACVLGTNTSVPLLQTRVLVPSHTHLPARTFTGHRHLPPFPSAFSSVTVRDLVRSLRVIIYYSTLPTVSK